MTREQLVSVNASQVTRRNFNAQVEQNLLADRQPKLGGISASHDSSVKWVTPEELGPAFPDSPVPSGINRGTVNLGNSVLRVPTQIVDNAPTHVQTQRLTRNSRSFMNSTAGLTQGLHKGRHG